MIVSLGDPTTAVGTHIQFTSIGYHILLIGSKFNAAANSGVSAAMARISKFERVTDPTGAIEKAVQFTF